MDQLRISESQEDDLVRWILRQEGLGYAPSHAQVRAIVVSLLNRQGDPWEKVVYPLHQTPPWDQDKVGPTD